MEEVHLVKTNEFPILLLSYDQKSFISTEERMIDALKKETCTGYKIVADDKTVGFIMIRRFGADKVFLWNMLIDARYQKQGFGKASLRSLADLLKSEGMKTLTTTCSINNSVALAFYLNFGFSHVETIRSGKVHEMNLMKHLCP
ncbi:MAG: GNAT family N-acetyltransferase [Erysipelotrichales bacterium]|nr:MAG: GNAT family N-acetyltransferase [Erysipelotrichales bacterium]